MIDRTKKLRVRRGIKKRRQQVEDIGISAEQGLEAHFFKRLGRLMGVWRFVAGWFILLILVAMGTVLQVRSMSQYYQVLEPAPGGTYTEGIIGTFTTANPLYANSAADSSVARLIFSGLLKYDIHNKLVPDLAESFTIDPGGKVYTVKLRNDVKWHDGQPFTATDVAFTYSVIKNPDARSPYFNTWKDVTVTQKDARTIVFELPSVLASFPETLTNGIVPQHILGKMDPSQLRTSRFNSISPVGTGPFMWDQLEVAGDSKSERQEIVGMLPNEEFYRPKPKLNRFILRTFRDEAQMVQSFKAGELTSMAGLDSVPEDVRGVGNFKEYSVPLTGEVTVFFKNSQPPLNNEMVRRALVRAVSPEEIISTLGYPVEKADAPLLPFHIGYNPKLVQLPTDMGQAEKYLDKEGWKRGAGGIRSKKGVELGFTLQAQNTSDYRAVTSYLQKAWRQLGVKVDVQMQGDADMQGILRRHDYQAVLYGISIGIDPDVFAYWHSSQASPSANTRLNLSEYKNSTADAALEAGRTRLNSKVRASKYQPFLKVWREDAPALALYQPTVVYVSRGDVFNFQPDALNDLTGRYANVENWMIRQERVDK
jgi:peptide/nickel transport system substrate-binding protein